VNAVTSLGCRKLRGISWIADEVLGPQEELCFLELTWLVYESSVQRWMVALLMSGVLEDASKVTNMAWEFSREYWQNHEEIYNLRVFSAIRIGKFLNTSPDRYRTQACWVMDPKWRVRAWIGLISLMMVTKRSGGGGGCWRSGDFAFHQMWRISTSWATVSDSKDESCMNLSGRVDDKWRVEWQNGVGDNRRTAIEGVGGGMI